MPSATTVTESATLPEIAGLAVAPDPDRAIAEDATLALTLLVIDATVTATTETIVVAHQTAADAALDVVTAMKDAMTVDAIVIATTAETTDVTNGAMVADVVAKKTDAVQLAADSLVAPTTTVITGVEAPLQSDPDQETLVSDITH